MLPFRFFGFPFCYKHTQNCAIVRYLRAAKRSTVKRRSTANTRKNMVRKRTDAGAIIQGNERETMQAVFHEQETALLVEHDEDK